MKDKSEIKAKKISYLLYSYRSLRVNRKSYIVLFISIICMVMMSSNLIIYNSSYSNGENETLRRQYGDYYVKVNGLSLSRSNAVDMLSYVKSSVTIPYLTKVSNPNESSSVSEVKLAVYNGSDMSKLYFSLTEGSLPSGNQLLINDTISRAFNIYTGDTVTLKVSYMAYTDEEIMFTVSGMFDGSDCLDQYMFISDEFATQLLEGNDASEYYLTDKYITFKSTFNGLVNRYTASLLTYLELVDSNSTASSAVREAYQNEAIVNMKQFYQKYSFLITIQLSIVPAAIAILVFITLDVFKNLKELSILSMLGTTPKQFLKMLFLKYFYIYIIAFPCGLAFSSALIGILCAVCDNMNYNEQIYLDFYISPLSVIIMFVLCLLILFWLTYFISKKTTSGTYAEMLSGANSANNIFVQRTSGKLLQPGRRERKLSMLFFVRNRNMNALFCAVIAVLIAVMTYFTSVLSQTVGNMPVTIDRGDYSLTGDSVRDTASTTISAEAIAEIEALDGVKRVVSSYSEYSSYAGSRPKVYIRQNKTISKVKTGLVGTLQKTGTLRARVISEEYDRAELLYGQYVVSGDLASLYDDSGSIAIFVHTWANSSAYYRAGDQIELAPAYELNETTENITSNTSYRIYTVGAVLYDPFDEYESTSLVSFLAGSELFSELTGIDSPTRLDIVLEDESDEAMDALLPAIRDISKKYNFIYTNERTEYLKERSAVISSVMFYIILWATLAFILVLMLVSMTEFMLGSHKGNIRTIYMLGAKKKYLFGVCGTEMFACGVCSAAVGILLSLLVIAAYSAVVATVTNGYTVAIMVSAVVFSCALAVLIPYLTSYNYFRREKFLYDF